MESEFASGSCNLNLLSCGVVSQGAKWDRVVIDLGVGLYLGSGLSVVSSIAVSGLFMHPLMVTSPGKTSGSVANPGMWSYEEGELVYRR